MRFLSLFSGIEAASVAFLPLGWECVGFSEIEPFCCEVLKYHYPAVKNLGDITKITKKQIEALGRIDVVIYGFPCQDLSVAGQRKGLKHEDGTNTRSGLFYSAARIVDWSKARWSIAENVPGLFSVHAGRDFASVVGELAGIEIGVPRNGWRNSGVALGKKGLVEWSVLDAQFFGLAQRRKRVFIVRDTGNWNDRPPFFLISKSLCGNPPTRGEKGEDFTHSLAPSIGASGRGFERAGETRGQDPVIPVVTRPLTSAMGTKWNGNGDLESSLIPEVSPVLTAKMQGSSGWAPVNETAHLLPVGYAPGCAPSRTARDCKGERMDVAEPSLIVSPTGGNDARAVMMRGREGCEGGGKGPLLSEEKSLTLAAHTNDQVLFQPIPIHDKATRHKGGGDTRNDDGASNGMGIGKEGDPMPTLDRASRHAVACAERIGTLRANPGMPKHDSDNRQLISENMSVRRLTPTECHFLQGFPRGYLDIPFRGKPATDGHKYRSLGNSMAVPCIRWLGQRIEMIDKL